MLAPAVAPKNGTIGSEEQLVSTFNELRKELLNMLACVLGNHEDAQDALQCAFINCWQARDGLGAVQNLRSWVWRVAMNAGKDLRRNAWRRKARPLTSASTLPSAHRSSP